MAALPSRFMGTTEIYDTLENYGGTDTNLKGESE